MLFGNLRTEVIGCGTHHFLEQREEELVLSGEVLAEAPQRLTRAFDDVLNGELRPVGTFQKLEACVEEALDPFLRSGPSRVERPGDSQVTSADAWLGWALPVRRVVHRHLPRHSPTPAGPPGGDVVLFSPAGISEVSGSGGNIRPDRVVFMSRALVGLRMRQKPRRGGRNNRKEVGPC